ncbi:MAG: hypothetical protein M4D80_34300 [Myxococcota bacterium]|nr:hypothetical protein [Myxococcota bacterium]
MRGRYPRKRSGDKDRVRDQRNCDDGEHGEQSKSKQRLAFIIDVVVESHGLSSAAWSISKSVHECQRQNRHDHEDQAVHLAAALRPNSVLLHIIKHPSLLPRVHASGEP